MISVPLISPVLIVIGIGIISARRGVEFDLDSSTIRAYYQFLFIFKTGKKERLSEVDKIFINSGKVSQKVNTMVTTGITVRSVEYDAYLKFRNGKKFYLVSDNNKEKLMERLFPLEAILQTQIFDNTERIS